MSKALTRDAGRASSARPQLPASGRFTSRFCGFSLSRPRASFAMPR